jgi:hypothetical protein
MELKKKKPNLKEYKRVKQLLLGNFSLLWDIHSETEIFPKIERKKKKNRSKMLDCDSTLGISAFSPLLGL